MPALSFGDQSFDPNTFFSVQVAPTGLVTFLKTVTTKVEKMDVENKELQKKVIAQEKTVAKIKEEAAEQIKQQQEETKDIRDKFEKTHKKLKHLEEKTKGVEHGLKALDKIQRETDELKSKQQILTKSISKSLTQSLSASKSASKEASIDDVSEAHSEKQEQKQDDEVNEKSIKSTKSRSISPGPSVDSKSSTSSHPAIAQPSPIAAAQNAKMLRKMKEIEEQMNSLSDTLTQKWSTLKKDAATKVDTSNMKKQLMELHGQVTGQYNAIVQLQKVMKHTSPRSSRRHSSITGSMSSDKSKSDKSPKSKDGKDSKDTEHDDPPNEGPSTGVVTGQSTTKSKEQSVSPQMSATPDITPLDAMMAPMAPMSAFETFDSSELEQKLSDIEESMKQQEVAQNSKLQSMNHDMTSVLDTVSRLDGGRKKLIQSISMLQKQIKKMQSQTKKLSKSVSRSKSRSKSVSDSTSKSTDHSKSRTSSISNTLSVSSRRPSVQSIQEDGVLVVKDSFAAGKPDGQNAMNQVESANESISSQSQSGDSEDGDPTDPDSEDDGDDNEFEEVMDPDMISEVDADEVAGTMATRVSQTMVDFSNGLEIQQLNEKYNSLLVEFEVYQSSTDTVLNVLKVSNADLERQYKTLKDDIKKQRQNLQIKGVSKGTPSTSHPRSQAVSQAISKYSSRRSSRRSSFEDSQSKKSDSNIPSESTSHHLDSTVFLTMFNNMHEEIEQRFRKYHEILKGKDQNTTLQITLQKMEKRLDLNIQNILHSLAAKTDNNQFEMTIDSLVNKINTQFLKLSQEQEERRALQEKHRKQLAAASEDLALSDVISEVGRESEADLPNAQHIGPIPVGQQQRAGPTMPAAIKRSSLKETVLFMRFSSKLSKKADVSQFYTLQQEIFDLQSIIKKMGISRGHLATSIHQHDRELKQLKHAQAATGGTRQNRVSGALTSKQHRHHDARGGSAAEAEVDHRDLRAVLKSHKVWITRNSDDISSTRRKFVKIHDLLEKLKQFAGIDDDENLSSVTVINAPLSVRAASSPQRHGSAGSPFQRLRSKSPSRSHNVLDLSQSPSRQLLQSRGGMRSSQGLTSDDLIQEQLDVLALELETKANKGDLRKKVSRGELKKNLKGLTLDGQMISDNAYFSGRPLDIWKCISCDRPTKLKKDIDEGGGFQFPHFPISSKSRVQFNRTRTPPAFFRHGSPSPSHSKKAHSRHGTLPPLNKTLKGKDEHVQRPKTSPFFGINDDDQDKMTPKGGIVRVPGGMSVQRPITRQAERPSSSTGEMHMRRGKDEQDVDEIVS